MNTATMIRTLASLLLLRASRWCLRDGHGESPNKKASEEGPQTSQQAQILIPMATSIGFGELFATVLVLYHVPVGYSICFSESNRESALADDTTSSRMLQKE